MPSTITSYDQLRQRITALESQKDQQEDALKQSVKRLFISLQPAEIIKNTVADLRQDKQFSADAGQVGLELGLNFLVGKLFKKDSSLGTYLKTVVMQYVAGTLLKKYGPVLGELLAGAKDKLVDFISKHHNSEKDPDS